MATDTSTPIDADALIDEYHQRVKNDRAESTADRYRGNVREWIDWCDNKGIPPLGARPSELKTHLREMANDGYGQSSLKIRRAAVSMLYEQCRAMTEDRTVAVDIDPGDVAENPSEELDLTEWQPVNQGTAKEQALKKQEGIHYVTPEEKESLCDNVDAPSLRNELIVRVLYQTGLREDELAQTRLQDLDRTERSIQVRADKTYLNRTVYYRPSLDFLLDQWIDGGYRDAVPGSGDSEYLFPTPDGENDRITGSYINQIVRRAADNAGLQSIMYVDAAGSERALVTAHALRHGHAVQFVKNGGDIRNLQKLLGHSNISQTEKYLRIVEDDVREAARKFGPGKKNDETDD